MRINSINHVNQVYKRNQVKPVNSISKDSQTDALSISSKAKDYQVARKALSDIPDVREDKVNDIKARIQNGTYEVSAEDFAQKLVEAYHQKYV